MTTYAKLVGGTNMMYIVTKPSNPIVQLSDDAGIVRMTACGLAKTMVGNGLRTAPTVGLGKMNLGSDHD